MFKEVTQTQKKLDHVVVSALRDISHTKSLGSNCLSLPCLKLLALQFQHVGEAVHWLAQQLLERASKFCQVHHAPHSFTQRTKFEGEGADRSKCDQIQTISSLKDILLCKSVLCTKMHNHGPAIGGESQAPDPAACLPKFVQALLRGQILVPETPIVRYKLRAI